MIFKDKAEYEETDSELAKYTISYLHEEIGRLKKENNILRKNAEHNDEVVDKVNWENMLLKKRNHKAIEYIEKQTKELYKNWDIENFDFEELLNILKGR